MRPMTEHAWTPAPGDAVMRDALAGQWLLFQRPHRILTTRDPAEVAALLAAAEEAVQRRGQWAAGFISYEAAGAFDPALKTHAPPADLPLIWFGLYDAPRTHELLPWPRSHAFELGPLTLGLEEEAYARAIGHIKQAIARGDTYQVNFTFPITAALHGDPWAFFLKLQHNQQARFAAYVDAGAWIAASASPELFFYRDGDRVWMRPMKGTAPRGSTPDEDEARARALAHSEKNRAENVMIVDMIRNDLGRIARVGSVETPELFRIEPYPTLFQMTSSVQARTDASLPELIAALFPSASVTGAPKVRTMQLIHELEKRPRGLYTGAMGFLTPDGRAQFNVAIRTAAIHRASGRMTYGAGSGVVWDSHPGGEYEECLLKARVLTHPLPAFDLLESLLWTPDEGFVLLERHLRRLCASAHYFHFPCPEDAIRRELAGLAASLEARDHKVRLLLDPRGRVRLEAAPLKRLAIPQRVALADFPVEPDNPFLRHKTTHRRVYDSARRSHPHLDDVILWNRRGELTESTRANLVLFLGGEPVTPAAASGLLPGVLRAELLEASNLREQALPVELLARADGLLLINAVRGAVPARLIPAQTE